MKKLILAVLLLSSCAGPKLPKFRAEPKFLVAGQSNAVSPAQEHPDHYSSTGLVTLNDFYGDNSFRVPTKADPMTGGVAWIYLGDMMNRKVTFNIVAQGNTSTRKWKNELFESRMLPALLKEEYDAILWVQGESDVAEHISMEETYQNMKEVIIRSRQYTNATWYVALDSNLTNPRENSVRRAQRRIIYEGLAAQGSDCDTMRENPDLVEDSFGEFVGEGLRRHAELWFEVLKERL